MANDKSSSASKPLNAADKKAELKLRARTKSLKFTIISWALILMVIAASIPINLIAERLDIKLDVTPNKYHTISDTTKNVLSRLEEDVVIYFLADLEAVETNSYEMITASILHQYEEDDRVTLVSFDPIEEPDKALALDPDGVLNLSMGDIVVKGEKLMKRVERTALGYTDSNSQAVFTGENYITGAIQYIINGEVPTVYFLTGHEELNVNDNLATICTLLRAQSYRVAELNLKTEADIPDDAKIIICAGPKSDFSDVEADKINAYLDKGGKISFLLQPNAAKSDYINIERILKKYAMGIRYDRIHETDPEYHIKGDEYTLLCDVTEELDSGLTDYFASSGMQVYIPNTRRVEILNSSRFEAGRLTTETLFTTHNADDGGSAVSEPMGGSNADAQNETGSFRLALTAVDEERGGSKVTLFGSCDFLNDDTIESDYSKNIALFYLSTISWMYDSNIDLMIPGRTQALDSIKVENESSGNTIITILVIIPVSVALVGVLVWLRRRNG